MAIQNIIFSMRRYKCLKPCWGIVSAIRMYTGVLWLSPNVFILDKNIAKYKDMPYWRRSVEIGNWKWPQEAFLRLIFLCKNDTFSSSWPWWLQNEPIVYILSEYFARYDDIQYGWSLVKIRNPKWPCKYKCASFSWLNMDTFFSNLACRLV
jgi:hypothetical protein